MSKCPITIACDQLKEGGFSPQDDNADNNAVIIGSGKDANKYILDDVNYYISSRSIEVARFFVDWAHNQSGEDPEAFVARMFAYAQYKVTREYVYLMIMRECVCIQLLARQLSRLSAAVIADIEQSANKPSSTRKISAMSACNVINRSMNSLLYSPEILHTIIGELAEYIGKSAAIPQIEPMNAKAAAEKPPARSGFKTAQEFAKAAIAFEQETAKYAKKIEEYHCKMIEIVNELIQYINSVN